ncbi:LPXTG cell wall anchor domain-containing protein [Nocardia zapadnayensis]|nr:LPXTG cell wall anchor domain-containing protein [Nocardia zapadnayensis]MCX0276819.1 LPXTG cell wall anchor domain-containing protein [Nocardia zapadnayensis]
MKKSIVLAPAVALALTGLGTPVAFAQDAEPTETPSETTPEEAAEAEEPAPAEELKAEAPTYEAEEPAPKKAAEQKRAEDPVPEKAEQDSESAPDSSSEPGDSEDQDANDAEASTGSITTAKTTINADEVEAGFVITVENNSPTAGMSVTATAEPGGSKDLTVAPGAIARINVTELSADIAALRADGGTITVTGTFPDDEDGQVERLNITVNADEGNGTPSPGDEDEGDDAPGDEDEGGGTPGPEAPPSEDDDADDAAALSLSISPEQISAADFVDKDKGVTIAASGCEPGTDATIRVSLDGSGDIDGLDDVETAAEDGTVSFRVWGDSARNPAAYEGTYNVVVDCEGEDALTGSFRVGDPTPPPGDDDDDDGARPGDDDDDARPGDDDQDEAVARSLAIDPERISAADFVKEQAVSITATGCTPGTAATLTVTPSGSSGVTGHTDTQTVGKDGTVTFGVRGINADAPHVYVGTYDVRVACEGGEDLTGEFVVGDPSRGGSDDSGHDDGRSLPRTGTELSGLAAGAALLVIGGASLLVTRRRGAGSAPGDI